MQNAIAAVKAVIQNDNKFLTIKQNINGQIFWDLPGGKVDYGETPFDTLRREVKEEVGLDIVIEKPLGLWWFFREKDKAQVVCTTFMCRAENEEIDLENNPTEEEIVDCKWLTPAEFLSDKYPVSNESLKKLIANL
ncbi:NUDIX domain-containing protein [Patescibacteria group bacterium]